MLGALFKTRSRQTDKTNLMVFIRPKILRDGFATALATNAKYNYIRDEQRATLRPKTEVLPLTPSARSRCCRRCRSRCRHRDSAGHAQGPDGTPREPGPHARTAANHAGKFAAEAMNEVAAAEVVRPQRVGFAFAKRHGVLVIACTKASPSASTGLAPRRSR